MSVVGVSRCGLARGTLLGEHVLALILRMITFFNWAVPTLRLLKTVSNWAVLTVWFNRKIISAVQIWEFMFFLQVLGLGTHGSLYLRVRGIANSVLMAEFWVLLWLPRWCKHFRFKWLFSILIAGKLFFSWICKRSVLFGDWNRFCRKSWISKIVVLSGWLKFLDRKIELLIALLRRQKLWSITVQLFFPVNLRITN